MISSTTRWTLAHKKLVIALWALMTIAGIAASGKATKALSTEYSIPGREGYETNKAISARFGNGGDGAPLVVVTHLPRSASVGSPRVLRELRAVETRLHDAITGVRTASYASTRSDALLSADKQTTFVVAYPPPTPGSYGQSPKAVHEAAEALAGRRVAGAPVYITGLDALNASSGDKSGFGVVAEGLIGGVGALFVLAFVFASFLAVVPLVIALASIMTCFLAIWGLASLTAVSSFVEFLIALVGLGVAIDYTLLVTVRWREEQANGCSGDEAIVRAMTTAGRAVALSGTTVAIGLLSLVVMPVPFLRSMGFGGLLIPLVSVLATLTLLPVLLATAGPRLAWPNRRGYDRPSRAWSRWAQLIVRRRWAAAIVSVAILAALLVAAAQLKLGAATGNADSLSQHGSAKTGLTLLERSGIGAGALTPIELLTPSRNAVALGRVVAPGGDVTGTIAPRSWRAGSAAVVDVFSHSNTEAALAAVRGDAHRLGAPAGGIDAQNRDFESAVYGSFPLMVALIALLTFVLLARAFRSLLLPAKAVALNVLGVASAWGVLTLVWQKGHGAGMLWGYAAVGFIPSWLPLIVFAFLFGLSMDYEVFILSRIREEFDSGAATDSAVTAGLSRTGRLVTSAGLILFLAFVAMSTAPNIALKMMATGLGAGIILDATVIRGVLLPAAVSLFGRWNWAFPRWAARLLRVDVEEAKSDMA